MPKRKEKVAQRATAASRGDGDKEKRRSPDRLFSSRGNTQSCRFSFIALNRGRGDCDDNKRRAIDDFQQPGRTSAQRIRKRESAVKE